MTTALYPSGIVTFVFTDVEGSTTLRSHHPTTFQPVLDRHNCLLHELVEEHAGFVIGARGDGFLLSFAHALDAVQFAVQFQLALTRREADWYIPPDPAHGTASTGQLRVRIGMHTGEAHLHRLPTGVVDYHGSAVDRAARVAEAGHGGQIVVSEATFRLVERQLPDPHPLQASWHPSFKRLRGRAV